MNSALLQRVTQKVGGCCCCCHCFRFITRLKEEATKAIKCACIYVTDKVDGLNTYMSSSFTVETQSTWRGIHCRTSIEPRIIRTARKKWNLTNEYSTLVNVAVSNEKAVIQWKGGFFLRRGG